MHIKTFKYLSLSSTNSEAFAKLHEGESFPFVVIADQQTSGRGRKKRDWYSPKGGLWFSIALGNVKRELLNCLSLKTAAIVLKSLHEFTSLNPLIKLPNDLIVNEKKICGILIEIKGENVVVGIGINTNILEFPYHLSRTATSVLIETGKTIDNGLLANVIAGRVLQFVESKECDESLLDEVETLLYGIGRVATVLIGNKKIKGKFIGITRSLDVILESPSGVLEYCPLHLIRNFTFQPVG